MGVQENEHRYSKGFSIQIYIAQYFKHFLFVHFLHFIERNNKEKTTKRRLKYIYKENVCLLFAYPYPFIYEKQCAKASIDKAAPENTCFSLSTGVRKAIIIIIIRKQCERWYRQTFASDKLLYTGD